MKLRVKPQASARLGMDMPGMPGQGAEREPEPEKKDSGTPGVKDLLKGRFGR